MHDSDSSPPRTLVSIFDVDRTITRYPTYGAFLLLSALRLKPWRLLLLPLLAPCVLAYATGRIERRQMKTAMHRLILGKRLRRAQSMQAAGVFAETLYKGGLYKGALARIAIDRAEGRRVILATAAPELYIRPLAQMLGLTDVVSTRCQWRDDHLEAGIAGENCYGEAKLRMIQHYLKHIGADRGRLHIRAYSDHASDLPMLEWADEAIAVNASPKLLRVASNRGWEIVDWKAAQKQKTESRFNARRLPA